MTLCPSPALHTEFSRSCSWSPSRPALLEPLGGRRRQVRNPPLEVRNDQWDDLAVYLERGGALLKLGTVPGLSTRVLKVPAEYLRRGGSVRLKAMRPGSGVLAASVPFNLVQGQRAEWVAARTSGPTGVAVR
jgi:hypothetical protein